MDKSSKWVGLAAALVCAGSAMAAGKTEAASSTIGANIDTAVDLSASPTLQRWQAGGTVVGLAPSAAAAAALGSQIDTHTDTHHAAVIDGLGRRLDVRRVNLAFGGIKRFAYVF